MRRQTRSPRTNFTIRTPAAASAVMHALITPSGWAAAQDPGSQEAADSVAGRSATQEESAVHPAPPRSLFLGFAETTGHTLPGGQGHVSVGYMGSSILAQRAGFGNIAPFVVHAAYGITDNVTITAGSGFFSDFGEEETFFIPFVAGLRFLGTTLDGEIGLAVWSEDWEASQPVASLGYRF